MRKLAQWTLVVLGIPFFLIQLLRPERANPPVDPSSSIEARLVVPPKVAAILDRSCKDCHSNVTRWPWYSNVAPLSWVVARDVAAGRERLNFSEWASYRPERADASLIYVAYSVRNGSMPLGSYLRLHSEARLSATDVETLATWAERAVEDRAE